MPLHRLPVLEGEVVPLRPLREGDFGALDAIASVEKLGAVRVGTEVDPYGRGENHVFRLRGVDFTGQLG